MDTTTAYAHYQRRRGLAESTIKRRQTTLWAFRMWLGHDVITASEEEVEAWLDSLNGLDQPNLRPRARYCYLSNLGCFYRFAVREGIIDRDPTARIDRPKLPPLFPRPIPDDDLALALREATPRVRLMLVLGAFAGLRCLEVAGLDREHVLERQSPPWLHVVHGKGARQRVVPLNPRVVEAMRLADVPRRGPVVRRCDGGRLAPYTVGQTVRQHFADLGIEATFHMCRHFFGTKILQATGNMRAVQILLGHAHISSSAGYAAWAPDQKAIDVVQSLGVNGDRSQERVAEHGGKR